MIEISAHINLPTEKTWQLFNLPEHIVKWNHADDSWHSPDSPHRSDLIFARNFPFFHIGKLSFNHSLTEW